MVEFGQNSDLKAGVSFIIFFKDLDNEPIDTAKNILNAMFRQSLEIKFEIIFVRDGGSPNIRVEDFDTHICEIKKLIVSAQKSSGVSAAILRASGVASFTNVCFVPGNNQFTLDSYSAVASRCLSSDIVLGCRKNLQSRPFPKIVASRASLLLVKSLFRKNLDFVRDIHGLNSYRTLDAQRLLVTSHGHGNNISMIVPLRYEGKKFDQVDVFLLEKNFTIGKKIFKFTNLAEVRNFLIDLARLWTQYRFKNKT